MLPTPRQDKSGPTRGAGAELGLGNDDNVQYEDGANSQTSAPLHMGSNRSQTTSQTSLSRWSRSKRHRSTSRTDRRRRKAARVDPDDLHESFNLPSDTDEAEDGAVHSRTGYEAWLRQARAGERRATTVNPPPVS